MISEYKLAHIRRQVLSQWQKGYPEPFKMQPERWKVWEEMRSKVAPFDIHRHQYMIQHNNLCPKVPQENQTVPKIHSIFKFMLWALSLQWVWNGWMICTAKQVMTGSQWLLRVPYLPAVFWSTKGSQSPGLWPQGQAIMHTIMSVSHTPKISGWLAMNFSVAQWFMDWVPAHLNPGWTGFVLNKFYGVLSEKFGVQRTTSLFEPAL